MATHSTPSRAPRTIFLALVFTALLVLAWPWIDTGIYAMRLVSMPEPAAIDMPVAGLKRGAWVDTWHAPRAPGRRHEGIDIFAKKGAPVLATTEGIITGRGVNSLGGNAIWLLGPGGQRHYYAHLDRFADVSVGDRVKAGDLIGYVGNTGNARTTPPHLHYGIYGDGGAINPYPLLAAKRAPKM